MDHFFLWCRVDAGAALVPSLFYLPANETNRRHHKKLHSSWFIFFLSSFEIMTISCAWLLKVGVPGPAGIQESLNAPRIRFFFFFSDQLVSKILSTTSPEPNEAHDSWSPLLTAS